jgi:uncharacterized glyoxalase superfamily protein PhnB
MHAEITIGGSILMLGDEMPNSPYKSPQTLGGTAVSIHLYVADVDASYARAVAAGATGSMPPQDMFWGDRFGQVTDPFGHRWSLATHVREPSPEEITAGAAAMSQEC